MVTSDLTVHARKEHEQPNIQESHSSQCEDCGLLLYNAEDMN